MATLPFPGLTYMHVFRVVKCLVLNTNQSVIKNFGFNRSFPAVVMCAGGVRLLQQWGHNFESHWRTAEESFCAYFCLCSEKKRKQPKPCNERIFYSERCTKRQVRLTIPRLKVRFNVVCTVHHTAMCR